MSQEQVSREKFLRYVELQKKGGFNMFELSIRHPDEFSKDDVLHIVQNYSELAAKYKPVGIKLRPCAVCGKQSKYQCSKCKQYFYCGTACQVDQPSFPHPP